MAQHTFLKGDHRLHDSLQLRLGRIGDHCVRHGEKPGNAAQVSCCLVAALRTVALPFPPHAPCACATGARPRIRSRSGFNTCSEISPTRLRNFFLSMLSASLALTTSENACSPVDALPVHGQGWSRLTTCSACAPPSRRPSLSTVALASASAPSADCWASPDFVLMTAATGCSPTGVVVHRSAEVPVWC